jgi:protein tyrosine phosphatase (PTP) superfamily phosphohydrolase (DUF442 family)
MARTFADIRNFVQLDERIGTSGMPQPADFSLLAQAGFKTVINLALPTSDNAMANEGELVTREGMNYFQIPIRFDAPRSEDYRLFKQVMEATTQQKVFVHCAANMRVSAFMFLFRIEKRLTTRQQAEADLFRIWQPDEVWRRFINQQLPDGEASL